MAIIGTHLPPTPRSCCATFCPWIGAVWMDGRSSSRLQWLRESETIVIKEHKLLFCAPPNTGSLQFRMLAKRMKVRVVLLV